ncbi:MAG: protein kinase domain-containing protein [Thermoguttaceae bacterium]
MSTFKTVCPHCSHAYELDAALLGKKGKCSKCRERFMLNPSQEESRTTNDSRTTSDSQTDDSQASAGQANDRPTKSSQPPPNDVTSSYVVSEKVPKVPTSEYWVPGDLVLGMYEVRELAPGVLSAQGGAGIVQRVYHREWDMDLAVKSPKQGVLQSEAGIAHYERECQTWVELGLHPNIVTCYLIRRIDNIPRIFAEFVPDGSLRDWMVDGRLYEGGSQRTLIRILDVAIQFAWGLDYAHRQNLLHLDIKPANVMMSAGIPKVADFGLAQAIPRRNRRDNAESGKDGSAGAESGEETATQTRGTLKWEGMTPAYCSPEQFQASVHFQAGITNSGLKMTRQSDIWSWALTVFAMFYGQAPCKKGGQTAGKVLEVYLKMPTPANRPAIPPALVDVLKHCFQENPQDRPRTLSEVAKQLVGIYEKESGVSYKRREPTLTTWTAESVNNRALSMLDLNKPKEADRLFQEALGMQPWEPTVTYNQILLKWRRGECTDLEGVFHLEMLVKTRPHAVSYFGLGLFQRERGNIPSALDAFNTAWELEQRPEIERAVLPTVALRSRNVKYTERLIVSPFSSGVIPPNLAFWHATEKRLLLSLDSKDRSNDFVLIDPKTGRTVITFKGSSKSSQAGRQGERERQGEEGLLDDLNLDNLSLLGERNTLGERSESAERGLLSGEEVQGGLMLQRNERIALSEDFQWELFLGEKAGTLRVQHAGEPGNHLILEPAVWGNVKKSVTVPYVVSEHHVDEYTKLLAGSERPKKQELQVRLKENKVEIFDVRHSQKTAELVGHEGEVQSVCIHRSGRWIATGGKDGTVRLWELPNGRCLRTLENVGRSVDALSFSESGEYLLSLSEKKHLRIWKIGILTRQTESLRGPIQVAQISSSEEVTRLQNEMSDLQESVETAIEEKDFSTVLFSIQRMQRLPGWESARTKIPWEMLICNCFREKLSDAIGSPPLSAHSGQVSSVAVSLDGRLGISAGEDRMIRLWNTETQQCLRVLEGHQDWVRSIALSLDSRYLLSGSWDMTARVWNVSSGKTVLEYPDKIRSLTKVRLHPSAKMALLANASGMVFGWNVLENRVLGQWNLHKGNVNSLSFNRDGRYFVSAGDDATIRLCETSSGRPVRTWTRGKSPIIAARFSPDGQRLYWASKEGMIEVWNILQDYKERSFSGHLAELLSMEPLIDGRFLLTTSKDKTIKVWNVQEGLLEQTLSGHSAGVTGVSANVSGLRLLSGSDDGTLCIWNLFWDFLRPQEDWDPNARCMLHALLSTFCEGPDLRVPALNQGVVDKLRLEMGYRNYGWISLDRLRQEVTDILTNWSGPISLEATSTFSGRKY